MPKFSHDLAIKYYRHLADQVVSRLDAALNKILEDLIPRLGFIDHQVDSSEYLQQVADFDQRRAAIQLMMNRLDAQERALHAKHLSKLSQEFLKLTGEHTNEDN